MATLKLVNIDTTQINKPFIIDIKDKATLYNYYMPFLKNAGLFIPTPQEFSPQSKALVLLTLPDEKTKRTVSGKICWITPKAAQIGQQQGVGIHFDDSEQNRLLRSDIEKMLAGILDKTENRTQTV